MSTHQIPPPATGGKPQKYVPLIINLQVGQFVEGLKSPAEQVGVYYAALRHGKYALIRTVKGERRVYIVSKETFDAEKKKNVTTRKK